MFGLVIWAIWIQNEVQQEMFYVKEVGRLHNFWAYKALQIGIGHWTIEGLNFEFLLNFVEFCFLVHFDGD